LKRQKRSQEKIPLKGLKGVRRPSQTALGQKNSGKVKVRDSGKSVSGKIHSWCKYGGGEKKNLKEKNEQRGDAGGVWGEGVDGREIWQNFKDITRRKKSHQRCNIFPRKVLRGTKGRGQVGLGTRRKSLTPHPLKERRTPESLPNSERRQSRVERR